MDSLKYENKEVQSVVNKNLLRSKMIEKGVDGKGMCVVIEKTEGTFSQKINGRVPFTADEILRIKNFLSLSPEDVDKIFLS